VLPGIRKSANFQRLAQKVFVISEGNDVAKCAKYSILMNFMLKYWGECDKMFFVLCGEINKYTIIISNFKL